MLIPHLSEAAESTFDCLNQRLLGDRLRQEVLGTGLDDLHCRLNVGVTCQEDDWQA
jgi:hypothetical protein